MKVLVPISFALVLIAVFLSSVGRTFLGVPNVAYEAAAAALVCSLLGNKFGVKLSILLPIGVWMSIAVVLDPYIWSNQGYVVEGAQVMSLIINGMLGSIMISAYLLGALVRFRNSSRPNLS